MQGISEHIICFPKSSSFTGRLLAHFRWQRFFRKAVKEYTRKNGKPDLVHVHVPMRAGLIALWIKRKYRIPFVVTEHWGIYNDREALNFSGRSRVFRQLTTKIFTSASAFTTVSHFLGLGVNSLVARVPYQVVPNVANTNLFFYDGDKPGRFRFIHVSNMVPLKNVQGIINSFLSIIKEGFDADLVLVGDRDPGLKHSFSGIPSEHIHFRGEVAYENVAREMQQAHCLVVFSDIENAPCVISEALCCGLPVIATETGGIPEMVNNSNGILVPPRDETALANAMKEIIAHYSRFDHNTISREAHARYSYESVGKQFFSLYQEASK